MAATSQNTRRTTDISYNYVSGRIIFGHNLFAVLYNDEFYTLHVVYKKFVSGSKAFFLDFGAPVFV